METVRIRVRKPTRVFVFLNAGIELRRDDACIVRSDRGLEWGVCLLPPEPCPPELERRIAMNVVRKATEHDRSMFTQLQSDEKKAREICLEKIRARELPMKLVDVEFTFDKQKIVFYFTAAERVDFRELVRDLARDLKTRIELRHIQVRDEAKVTGGVGMCGRELCCSTWMTEFKPISMRMAKRQNLSLNPQKISGQCGRLLCCLSYENELYKRKKEEDAREEGLDVLEETEDLSEEERELYAERQNAEVPSFLLGEDEAAVNGLGQEAVAVAEPDNGADEDGDSESGGTNAATDPAQEPQKSRRKRRRSGRRKHGGSSKNSG